MKRTFFIISILILLSIPATYAQADFIWGKQFGTEQIYKTRNLIANASGNIYVSGSTDGDMANPQIENTDAFLQKKSNNGESDFLNPSILCANKGLLKLFHYRAIAGTLDHALEPGKIGNTWRDVSIAERRSLVVGTDLF
jgi:hypothetical protein